MLCVGVCVHAGTGFITAALFGEGKRTSALVRLGIQKNPEHQLFWPLPPLSRHPGCIPFPIPEQGVQGAARLTCPWDHLQRVQPCMQLKQIRFQCKQVIWGTAVAGLCLPSFQDATSLCMLKWSLADAREHPITPSCQCSSEEGRSRGDSLGSQTAQWSPTWGKEAAVSRIFPGREK